jgi:hypothetical protein
VLVYHSEFPTVSGMHILDCAAHGTSDRFLFPPSQLPNTSSYSVDRSALTSQMSACHHAIMIVYDISLSRCPVSNILTPQASKASRA